jgi:SAM-dependent methyltransferase
MFERDFEKLLNGDAKELWPGRMEEIQYFADRAGFSISVDIIINQLGLFQKKNDFETFDSIKTKINLFEHAEYVFVKMLDILCQERVLEKKDGGYICLDSYIEVENPCELLTQAAHTIPQEGFFFQWMARSFGSLSQFIGGKVFGEEVMFPFNDFNLIEKMYYTSDVTSFYPRLAGKAIKRIIDSKVDKVCLLEVGAGTGNSADNVLKEFDTPGKYFEKYYFTDIAKGILKRSRKKFAKFEFMDFRLFDLCQDFREQGLAKDLADIVLAVNVLHATDNLAQSCKSLYELVKDNGYLVLAEIAHPEDGMYRFMELTFGLLRSYYLYGDKDFRPISPILRPDKWIEVLKGAGFREALAFPDNPPAIQDRGGIIIARR